MAAGVIFCFKTRYCPDRRRKHPLKAEGVVYEKEEPNNCRNEWCPSHDGRLAVTTKVTELANGGERVEQYITPTDRDEVLVYLKDYRYSKSGRTKAGYFEREFYIMGWAPDDSGVYVTYRRFPLEEGGPLNSPAFYVPAPVLKLSVPDE